MLPGRTGGFVSPGCPGFTLSLACVFGDYTEKSLTCQSEYSYKECRIFLTFAQSEFIDIVGSGID